MIQEAFMCAPSRRTQITAMYVILRDPANSPLFPPLRSWYSMAVPIKPSHHRNKVVSCVKIALLHHDQGHDAVAKIRIVESMNHERLIPEERGGTCSLEVHPGRQGCCLDGGRTGMTSTASVPLDTLRQIHSVMDGTNHSIQQSGATIVDDTERERAMRDSGRDEIPTIVTLPGRPNDVTS
jgi:hypothetical protein